jgi:paraquat-inducible protein B
MAEQTHPTRIGAFVVGAIALVLCAVLLWGSKALFERKYPYVCYFPGTVTGLSKGAPVKYRGVDVGTVKDIKVRFRQAPDDKRIPVFIELWGKRVRELGGAEPGPAMVTELAARGVRARLAFVSLVTGVAYVSLDEVPDSPPPVYSELPGRGAIPEIPTMPTELEEFSKAVSALLSNLSSTDFKGMADSVSDTMKGVNDVVASEDLHAAVAHLPRLMAALNRLAGTLNTDADKAGEVVEEARGALAALHDTLVSAQGVVSPQAPLSVDLSVALSDVDKAAIAVRELADFLRRNPHSIVAGTKPKDHRR